MRNNIILSSFVILTVLLLHSACRNDLYSDGKFLYETHCLGCHQADGQPVGLLIPPLAGSDFLIKEKDRIACIVKYGLNEEPIEVNGVKYNGLMYGVKDLTDIEVTNVINYINNAWGNDNGFTQLEEVQKALEKCKPEGILGQ